MCGICGIIEKNNDNEALVRQMCQMLAHRGPEKSSVLRNGDVCLGHRRLRIIDLETGDQPISNSGGTLTIIYNGEIYNYLQLREELREKGYDFRTQSDTEVILKLFEDQGVDSFKRLNGIFAFAILDNRNSTSRLILARDHFGIKPLHYFYRDNCFIFASEQKAILLHPKVKRQLNPQSLHYHLNLRYTQSNETLFKDIHRLPPAHYLVFEDSQIKTVKPYYRLNPQIDHSKTEAEWLEAIPQSLKQAVKRQLVSDVPIGVYLSGGMDSSSIVAMMREAGAEEINTFTLGFNEPTDELDDAQIVADHFQTNHHTLRMDLSPMQNLPRVIWHAEEPKINLLQGFLMSQFVSQKLKVVLGGLGGDELFAGYDIHKFAYPFNLFHKMTPAALERHIFSKLSSTIYSLQTGWGKLQLDEYRRGIQMALATGNIAKFYLILRNVWDFEPEQMQRIYAPEFLNQPLAPTSSKFDAYFEASRELSPINQVFFTEFHTKMVNDYLLTEDRMSMSHSVEERVPFLDLDLVNLGFSIPAKMKMRGNQLKYLLRKAMQPYLPERILRKKKWGFTFNPYLQYQKDLKNVAQQILTRKRIEKDRIINYEYIRSIFEAPPHPRMRWHYNFIWVLTGFYIWKQMFLESDDFIKREFELERYFGE